MLRSMRVSATVGAGLLALMPGPASSAPPRGSTAEEIRIGREVVAEIERSVLVSADTAAVGRLNRIARHLAPRTQRPLIEYQVKIIEAPVSNAFSIPGGFIYFTDKMVEECRSDDEIAGVMAHEIAHNARQHALTRMKRGSTQALKLAELISLGLLILTKGSEVGQAAHLGVSQLTQSIMASYSVEDEKDADARAVEYLEGSDYNPAGFLTFMERQATLQSQLTEELMGFYRTHPFSGDRVLDARRTLETRGLPIQRRAVGAAPLAELAMIAPRDAAVTPNAGEVNAPPETLSVDSVRVPAVTYDGDVLYYLGAADTSGIEARRNLDELNAILDRNDSGDSIRVFVGADGGARLATSEYRLEVSAADAVANDSDAVELAERLRDRIDALTELERRRVALLYYLIGSERETH